MKIYINIICCEKTIYIFIIILMDPKKILQNEELFKKFAKQVFDSFDKNLSGEIDKKELGNALINFAKESGTTIPDDEIIHETMKELDKNASLTLTIDEFETYVRTILIHMSS